MKKIALSAFAILIIATQAFAGNKEVAGGSENSTKITIEGTSYSGSLSEINATDIKSVTVSKDADSNKAIYITKADSANSPRITVNGVSYSGSLSEINATDIKSVTVSKDADSNSVVYIATKNGKTNTANSPRITVNGVSYSGSLSEINATDIKSVTVSKDADSNKAIYITKADDANSPHFIVNGVSYSGSLSEINATDVESVTVSKDADSNSVVYINTRK